MKKNTLNILFALAFFIPAPVLAQIKDDFKWQADTTIETIKLDTTYEVAEDEEPEPPPPQVVEESYAEDEEQEESGKYFSLKRNYPISIPISQRRFPADYLQKLKSDKAFWYADSANRKPIDTVVKKNAQNPPARVEKKEEKQEEETREASATYKEPETNNAFSTLLWILVIGGFIGAIIWYLTSKDVRIFRTKDKKTNTGIDDNLSEEDIFAINYQRDVERAEQAGNYRLAIRLRFLRLLKQMAERNIIKYKQDKTNFDYLLQLHSTAYYNEFFRITRSYEYSWYGKFDVEETTYAGVKNEFNQLEKQLGQ